MLPDVIMPTFTQHSTHGKLYRKGRSKVLFLDHEVARRSGACPHFGRKRGRELGEKAKIQASEDVTDGKDDVTTCTRDKTVAKTRDISMKLLLQKPAQSQQADEKGM